jgi:ATP-dependent Clp protease protease subunit
MWMDIYNAMGRERILFISRQLDDESVNTLIGSLLYLQGKSAEEKITLYLNIPGGEELSESIAP